jgi:serine phosphatase RsbU (regulator of sigma subunit)
MEIWGGYRSMDNAISVPGIDAYVYSEPYKGDRDGGDIHYVSMCGQGNISRFVVADVSGHGITIGSVAETLRKLVRKHINTPDQSRLTRAINAEFTALSREGRFATAILATYFAPTDHLIVCNAGHPPPLWYRAATGSWDILTHELDDAILSEDEQDLSNIPLGIIEPTCYLQFAVPLQRGDLIVLYTDSLTEAMSPDGKMLGSAGLRKLAAAQDATEPMAFARHLLDAVAAYRGNAPADDDVTLMVLHHNAADPPKQSLGEKIVTMAKMLGLGGS